MMGRNGRRRFSLMLWQLWAHFDLQIWIVVFFSASVNYILSLQQPNGNFPCATDEIRRKRPESDELVHWCHGASGNNGLYK